MSRSNNDRDATLTTSAGNPIADNQNSLSAGARGPLLLQDYQLIETINEPRRHSASGGMWDRRGTGYATRLRVGWDK